MGKPTVCIGENKGADQLRSNHNFMLLACLRDCTGQFVSGLVRNPNFGFLMHRLIYKKIPSPVPPQIVNYEAAR